MRKAMSLSFRHRLPSCLAWLALLGASALTACHSPETSLMNPAITPNGAVPSDVPLTVFAGDGPVYGHRNPSPQHAYELTMTIADAPGPFAVAEAEVSVQAASPACAIYHPFPGGAWAPRATVPLKLDKVSDSVYHAVFHTDPLLNEAYWKDKPACEWQFVAVSVFLKATGADGETGFNHSIDSKELASGQPVTSYFWKGGYPDDGHSNFADSGFSTPEKFKSELRNQLFSITLTAKRMAS